MHEREDPSLHPAMTRHALDVEKDAGRDNDLFLETLFEEGQPGVEGRRQAIEVEPDVECR